MRWTTAASATRILALVTFLATTQSEVPIEIKLWDTGRTPLAHMVDVTNEFGLKVLAEHNFLNDNNIAFSPYGLMGILVALYEGVDGESSYQIQRGMQLPWNRNIMRIGFRDIHRTLKTYFVPEEGFLAGLALNNENVTFNEGYRKILRFYGFDLDNDTLPTLPPRADNGGSSDGNGSTVMPTASTAPTAEETTISSMTTESAPARQDASTPTREETTLNPNAETITDIDIRNQPSTEATAAVNQAAESTVTETVGAANQETTTEQNLASETTIQANVELSSVAIETVSNSQTVVTLPSMGTETVAMQTSSPPTELTDPTTVNNVEMTPVVTPTAASPAESITILTTNAVSTAGTTVNTGTEAVQASEQTTLPSAPEITTIMTQEATSSDASTIETFERKKRSIVDFIFTNPPQVDDYLIYRSYDIGPDLPPDNYDNNQMFSINGLRNVQVSYMNYDTVLEHAFLPHLEAAALRLPLDSDRYYLLVVLPARGGAPDLGRLLARMARESDLSDVYAALRPRRVRATVPSFTVKGHITLTTDLQKLGIRDVFEPRQRDFGPLTRQAGVYVRSVEQAVSVAIRKYQPDAPKTNRYVKDHHPVTFIARHPFLYFVMDANIHVALMAGKMVDPLNTRIL